MRKPKPIGPFIKKKDLHHVKLLHPRNLGAFFQFIDERRDKNGHGYIVPILVTIDNIPRCRRCGRSVIDHPQPDIKWGKSACCGQLFITTLPPIKIGKITDFDYVKDTDMPKLPKTDAPD